MRVSEDVFSRTITDQEMLVNMKTGQYYGMDPVATRIWQCIKEQKTVPEIVTEITQDFAVDPAQAEADILNLISELKVHGLID